MPLKTIFFLGGFFLCCVGALVVPLWGIIGNVLYYTIGTGWWTTPIRGWGIRYSYILAVATALGVAINWRKLEFGKTILMKQEKLVLVFLAIVWLSTIFSETTSTASYLIVDHPSLKLTKFVIFAFLMTHIVTRTRNLNVFFWALIFGTIHLGIRAYKMPQSVFESGRLENVGGSDFRSANDLAVFLAVMMPIIGIMFLKTHWPGKLVCAICGTMACNAIVLTRSRAGLLGLVMGGVILAITIPKRHRSKIIACLIIAGLGFFSLMDTRFIVRSKTILEGADTQDRSAQSRMEIWKGGYAMVKDNPLGVGAGNFLQNIKRYLPKAGDRDAHSTYVRCAAELGVHGFGLLMILILNAALILRKIKREAAKLPLTHRHEFQMVGSALAASFAVFIVSGVFGTLLYFEAFWWFLLLPVCLQRCLDNQLADIVVTEKEDKKEFSEKPLKKKPSAAIF